MNIVDTTGEFFCQWNLKTSLTIEHLEEYFNRFPDIFDIYFKSHCTRTPERLAAAIERYPEQIDSMKHAAELLPSVIQEVYDQMVETLHFTIPLETRILVGAFGSNAYVTHDGTLHFAIELMPVHPNCLRVLVTHEMAHAFHFEMLRSEGFQFSRLAWDGYTSLYLEGLATLLSKILNPGLSEGVYFSFNDASESWVDFCRANYSEIIASLQKDLKQWTMDNEREWFRIRGNKKYPFDRIGYFVGAQFADFCVRNNGLKDTFTLWAHEEIKPIIEEWLDITC